MTLFYVGPVPKYKSSDEGGIRTYSEYHYIISESTDTPYVLWQHPNIPDEGDVHSQDPSAYVTKRNIVDMKLLSDSRCAGGKGIQWELEISYSSEIEIATNPLNTPCVIWSEAEQFQKAAEINRDDDLIVTTNDVPVIGLIRDDTRGVIMCEKNIALNSFPMSGLPDVVNSNAFTIQGETFDPNTLKFKYGGVGKPMKQNGVGYQKLKFSFHYREDLWKIYFPNASLYQKVAGFEKPVPCIDERGAPTTVPLPLLLNGEQASDTDISAGNAPIALEEDVYPEINFTTAFGSIIV